MRAIYVALIKCPFVCNITEGRLDMKTIKEKIIFECGIVSHILEYLRIIGILDVWGMVGKCKGSEKFPGKKGLIRISHCHIELPARQIHFGIELFLGEFLAWTAAAKDGCWKPSVGLTANTTSPTPLQRLNCFLESGSRSMLISILCKNWIGRQTETINSFFGLSLSISRARLFKRTVDLYAISPYNKKLNCFVKFWDDNFNWCFEVLL